MYITLDYKFYHDYYKRLYHDYVKNSNYKLAENVKKSFKWASGYIHYINKMKSKNN